MRDDAASPTPTQESDVPSVPRLAVEGGIATITLNRPAHRNRLENADLAQLMAHFARLDADPEVRVVVLRANTQGQPRPVFCAGYHLGSFDDASSDPTAFERCADAWAALRPITICALEGSVYGGATDLFVASDLRIAQSGVELRMPAAALGLHYYPSGLQRYVARMGLAFTHRAFLTARPISAQHLWDIGCLEALAGAEEFEETLATLARDVAALAPLAVQLMKQSIRDIALGQADLAQLRAREKRVAMSEDFAEGRKAFAERRPPRFEGR